ncbi:MAG TPA: hypothetical protein VGO57_03940 [Verrucomicrobiae bacterium]
MNRENQLLRRIRWWTCTFIFGLCLSGATAIPLRTEVNWLSHFSNADEKSSAPAEWLVRIDKALAETEIRAPFLFYGTDWLAFGHFIIALVFVGALRDPVRNRWLFDFGLIACALVIPFALIFGEIRGIPLWWRLIDCSFGIFGAIPLWFCRRWTIELENSSR